MDHLLDRNERRILGVLMEKELSQPQYYPMTLNAIETACNQKQNRDPVMDLDSDTIATALEAMRVRSLVTLVFPSPGARVNRFKHEAESKFGWTRAQRAIMTELLVRGPQTAGELRARCARMLHFADAGAILECLGSLGRTDPPYARLQPRQPGQSADRYQHLLYPESDQPTVHPSAPRTAEAPDQDQVSRISQQVVKLQEQVEDLQQRLSLIEKELS